MKNKKLSWILLPVVLGVWGMIGWKIYEGTKDEVVSDIESENPIYENTDTTLSPNEYALVLNYRDPFLDKLPKAKEGVSSIPKMTIEVQPVDIPSETWPLLLYGGLVREPKGGETVGFLTVEGQPQFVHTGDEIGNIRVGRITIDSIEIYMGKMKRYVGK
jgi:hypothetical protein